MLDDERTNILVVDDLPEKLLAYRTILDELGQNLITAGSGDEALRAVLRSDFAVVLLDVHMPIMNGLETAALIRQRRRSAHTPIIFLTAFSDEVHVAQGYAQGAVDYITTPVVPAILQAKVRVFCDLYRMSQQVRRQAEERIALVEERARREAAEEANRRSRFLADVSRALADSLDPATTAQTLARQAVPFLADLAGVTIAGEAGQPWQTELAWTDPDGPEPRTRRMIGPEGPQDELRNAVERALTHGGPERLDNLDLSYATSPHQPGHDRRVRSAVVLPLRARGRTLGVLTLAFGPSVRSHNSADVGLGEELAARAAIALDNARLYCEVQQADRQKNEFLSMLAHELRNPLAPIRNANEVLRQKGTEPARVRWAQGVIDRQLTHLVRLVDDLLDVSRLTQGKIRLAIEPITLESVVAQAVEAARPVIDQFRHELQVNLPRHPLRLTGDKARLTQVFTNLLNNAAKYTREGGRITLTSDFENDMAVVRVRDTGIGIPAELLPTVFDLFTQANRSLDRSQGGLGVGLTLVRRLVEMHGGVVEAHSQGVNRGSEFVVRLPADDGVPAESAGRAIVPANEMPNCSTRLRVVVVDDNVDAAESLADLLRLHDHDVRVAHDGLTGLATARGFRPDVVLLDIGLPGMDGYEVARQLRADNTHTMLLVAISGYGREEDRQLAREAGIAHHFVKPIQFQSLQSLLDTIGTSSAS